MSETSSPQPSPTPTLPPPKFAHDTAVRRSGMLAIIMIVTMILAAAAALVIFFALDNQKPKADALVSPLNMATFSSSQNETIINRLTNLESAVEDIKNRLAQLEQRAAEPPPLPQQVEQQPQVSISDQYGLMTQLSRLKADIDQLRAAQSELSAQAGGTTAAAQKRLVQVLYLSRLQQAIYTGSPYGTQLNELMQQATDDAQLQALLQPLSDAAPRGIPGDKEIFDRYQASVPQWQRVRSQSKSSDWWEKLLAELKGLVSIRAAQQWSADPALNDIGVALERKQYEAAAEALRKLQPELDTENLVVMLQTRAVVLQTLAAIEDHFLGAQKPMADEQP